MVATRGEVRKATVASVLAALVMTLAVVPVSAGAADDGERSVRVFAVAYKHQPDRVESYRTFRSSIRDLVRDEVAPMLADDRPNLVAFPENTSLMAYLIGARGAAARRMLPTVPERRRRRRVSQDLTRRRSPTTKNDFPGSPRRGGCCSSH